MIIDNIESFETQRMLARRIRVSDFDDVYRLQNDPDVAKTLGGNKTRDEINTFLENYRIQWERYGYCYWIFFSKDTAEFVGRGGLRHIQIEGSDEIEVGYAVMPKFWGKGFATEMGQTAIRIAFEKLGINKLACFTLPTNKASACVMEKLGFIYEHDFVYANLVHKFYRLKKEM